MPIVYTEVPKPSFSSSTTIGSSMGLLLLLTYSSSGSTVTDPYTEVTKPSSPIYSEVSKPVVPTYSETGKPRYTIDFLFQDGVNYFFQDGAEKVFSSHLDNMYGVVQKPTAAIYTEIVKPT